ncbi:hypothetical protein QWZ08_06720 [Ferruginibacter paludis]|uniref:hypothetical protein n=1 Tax=Ferruginibacter paludis TaxID=1310417 RepID=UPI0025B45E21|nr:hypothetical protein [Ferruginibacter paludis]MDN3655308.1 hypothetical protein [Ferruginibacter paludis]
MQTILSPLTGRQVITNSKAIAVNRAATRFVERCWYKRQQSLLHQPMQDCPFSGVNSNTTLTWAIFSLC